MLLSSQSRDAPTFCKVYSETELAATLPVARVQELEHRACDYISFTCLDSSRSSQDTGLMLSGIIEESLIK